MDFTEYKAKKEGRVTVKSVIENLQENSDHIENLIVIVLDKDGHITVGHSESDSVLKYIGLIEAGKNHYMESISEG